MTEGLAAVFTFPLRQGDSQLGALDVYRDLAGPLDAGAMMAAQTLADVASAYLLDSQAARELARVIRTRAETSLRDPLTALPNRTLLVQRLDHAMLRCQRTRKLVAILFVDLDDFKSINDTYGHHTGDELLIAVANRLTAVLRSGDTLARLGGDEFVVLCEDLDETAQGGPLAARIGTALAESFVLGDIEVQVSASVGIAFAGRGKDRPERAARRRHRDVPGQAQGRRAPRDDRPP